MQIPITYNKTKIIDELYIVPPPYTSIAGRTWLNKLNIIKINKEHSVNKMSEVQVNELIKEIKHKYAKLFEKKVGCVPSCAV